MYALIAIWTCLFLWPDIQGFWGECYTHRQTGEHWPLDHWAVCGPHVSVQTPGSLQLHQTERGIPAGANPRGELSPLVRVIMYLKKSVWRIWGKPICASTFYESSLKNALYLINVSMYCYKTYNVCVQVSVI